MEVDRSVRNPNRNSAVGTYTRATQEPVDPFNERIMSFKNDDASNLEDNPENWPAEKVRAAAEMFQRADQKQQAKVASGQAADAFSVAHPEYLDTPANGKAFSLVLRAMFGDVAYDIEEFEAAYAHLRDNNALALNQTEVEKQLRAAAAARVEAERTSRAEPSEDDMYSMSMDELRMRDALANQARMQKRGEEGGW